MAWYWIVALIFGILAAWGFTSAVLFKHTDADDVESWMLGLLLPVTFPFAIVLLMFNLFKKIV